MQQNKSGFYSNISVELSIDSLPITALLQANKIHDMEGASSAVTFDIIPQASLEEMIGATTVGVLPTYDETTLCTNAFRIMRQMVNTWLREVSLHKNVYADYQLVHFYRWIRSNKAYLYDPALRKTLNVLMRKLFLQVLAEFEKLGCQIIFADFTKIVLHTGKRTIVDAISYTDYIVQAIRNKEIFHSVHLSYQESWNFLLWLDDSNYAGVKANLARNLTEETANSQQSDFTLEMNWAIAEYLPNSDCSEAFDNCLSSYIELLTDGKKPEDALQELSFTLYETVQNLNKASGETKDGLALQFIKTVVKALSADKSLEGKVIVIIPDNGFHGACRILLTRVLFSLHIHLRTFNKNVKK